MIHKSLLFPIVRKVSGLIKETTSSQIKVLPLGIEVRQRKTSLFGYQWKNYRNVHSGMATVKLFCF